MAGADDIVIIHMSGFGYICICIPGIRPHMQCTMHMRSTTVTARLLCRDSDYFWDSVQHCTIQIAELRV